MGQWKRYEWGTICQWKVYEKGIFSVKNVVFFFKGKGLDLGAEPSPPPPPKLFLVLPGLGKPFSKLLQAKSLNQFERSAYTAISGKNDF